VTSPYEHIWDCCCDHGLLGFALLSCQLSNQSPSQLSNQSPSQLSSPKNSTVHFVDIVPELMAELDQKLHRFCPDSPWKTHCIDVAKLPLSQYEGKHLVIIAGVGGDLMIEFIEAINQQHKNLNIDFILCPVHHQYALREKLINLDFSLKDEVLVEENRRFYEVLLVSSVNDKSKKVTAVGDKIWQPLFANDSSTQPAEHSTEQGHIAKNYLEKTLKHYQRIEQGLLQSSSNNKVKSVQQIIDAYTKIAKR